VSAALPGKVSPNNDIGLILLHIKLAGYFSVVCCMDHSAALLSNIPLIIVVEMLKIFYVSSAA
jgi:hypothetical protein